MKVSFNKFERVAGLFVLLAIVGTVLTAVSVAIKQGWFETKFHYSTIFENADGVHPGTLVQISGLRAGSVESVELESDNRIKVNFYLIGKFESKVNEESVAQLIRPFIIGERVVDVTVGDPKAKKLANHQLMKSIETTDLMTLMGGKKLHLYMGQFTDSLEAIQSLLKAFLNKDRATSMVRIFDRIDPLVKNLNVMSLEMIKLSRQATSDERLKVLLTNVNILAQEVNEVLPELNHQNPKLAKDLALVIKNLATMTNDFKVLGRAVNEIGPELPQATRRGLEALNEAVVLLKAMQKSFVLKGNVDEVRKEESERRIPAGNDTNTKSAQPPSN